MKFKKMYAYYLTRCNIMSNVLHIIVIVIQQYDDCRALTNTLKQFIVRFLLDHT